MLYQEARVIIELVSSFYNAANGVVLNLGSSTREFRRISQPYIEEILEIFLNKSGQVVNIDTRFGHGIDLQLDFNTIEGESKLIELKPKLILVNNLLEHVEDINHSFSVLARVCKATGCFVLISGPVEYPFHPDPIDNGFRPQGITDFNELIDSHLSIDFFTTIDCGPLVFSTTQLDGYFYAKFRFILMEIYRLFLRPINPGTFLRGLFWQLQPTKAFVLLISSKQSSL